MVTMRRLMQLCLLLAAWRTPQLLCNAATEKDCTVEYLVTVGNTTEGVRINIFLDASDSLDDSQQLGRQEFKSDLAKGYFLSPFCGDDWLRCRNLFSKRVSTNSSTWYITIVPLVNGFLQIELVHNGYGLNYNGHTAIETTSDYGCSLTTIFDILDSVYAVCVNTKTPFITMLEIHLSPSSLKGTSLSGPLIHFPSADFHPKLSNFVFASLDDNSGSQYVVFTMSNKLWAFVPLDYSYYQLGSLQTCTSVQRLEYAGDFVLLAYCTDNNLVEYYDLRTDSVLNHTSFSVDGIPYLCPNRDVRFSVFSSYIQLGIWSTNSRENFYIPRGLNFQYGLCFGSESEINDTYFAFVDSQEGVFVLNHNTNYEPIGLSHKACLNACQPLMSFKDYLVLQEHSRGIENVIVVDAKQSNFSRVIEAWGVQADLVTMIFEKCKGTIPNGKDNPGASNEENGGDITVVVVTPVVVVCVILILLLVSVSAAVVIIYKQRRKNPPTLHVVCQVSAEQENQSSGLSISQPWRSKTLGVNQPKPVPGPLIPQVPPQTNPPNSESLSSERDTDSRFQSFVLVEETAETKKRPGGSRSNGIPMETSQPKLATLLEDSSEPPVPEPDNHEVSTPSPHLPPSPSSDSIVRAKPLPVNPESVNPSPEQHPEKPEVVTDPDNVTVGIPALTSNSSDSDVSIDADDRTRLIVGPVLPLSQRIACGNVRHNHRRQNERKDDADIVEMHNLRRQTANCFQKDT